MKFDPPPPPTIGDDEDPPRFDEEKLRLSENESFPEFERNEFGLEEVGFGTEDRD